VAFITKRALLILTHVCARPWHCVVVLFGIAID
jgi:hypothetical protein